MNIAESEKVHKCRGLHSGSYISVLLSYLCCHFRKDTSTLESSPRASTTSVAFLVIVFIVFIFIADKRAQQYISVKLWS
jgi:uncharacterized lipoprotein YajG